MSDQFGNQLQTRQTPLPPTRASGNHIYTKLQVHFGGDTQDVILKTEKPPTCLDLKEALQHAYRVPIDDQLIYYRGQRLHHQRSSNEQSLGKYGIFSGNTVKLVGKRGLL